MAVPPCLHRDVASTYLGRTLTHPICPHRRVHSAEFKAWVPVECRQLGTSASVVIIEHGLNINVERKWLVGCGIKRMVDAAPAAGDCPAVCPFRIAAVIRRSGVRDGGEEAGWRRVGKGLTKWGAHS